VYRKVLVTPLDHKIEKSKLCYRQSRTIDDNNNTSTVTMIIRFEIIIFQRIDYNDGGADGAGGAGDAGDSIGISVIPWDALIEATTTTSSTTTEPDGDTRHRTPVAGTRSTTK
jgi:hypothetical protein